MVTQKNVRSRAWEDRVQGAADMLGLIPVLNVPAEIVSGLISLKKRDFVGVALSIAGLVPVEGEWAVALKVARNADHLRRAVKTGARIAKTARKTTRPRQPRSAVDYTA